MATDYRGNAASSHSSRARLAGLLFFVAFVCTSCGDKPTTAEAPPPSPPQRESVLGKVIRFGSDGDAQQYRTSGWSKTEEQFTWSEGNAAKLRLPIGPEAGTIMIKARVAAFINPPETPMQPVEVYANGTKIADWQAANTAEFTATVPAALAANTTELELEFRTPKAFSPKSTGTADDPRVLGIAVHDLQLTRAQ